MPTPIAQDLQRQVILFAGGAISLGELRRRTTPAIYAIDEAADPLVADLADELTLRFAEHDHGDWDEDTLRTELRLFIDARSAPRSIPIG